MTKPKTHRGRKIGQLLELLSGRKNMLIVMQDYPDPDAIASAAALRLLANQKTVVQCSFGYGGTVGRAENQALVKYLGMKLHDVHNLDLSKFDVIAMVDTQPASGNNALCHDVIPDIVIDHHPIRSNSRRSPYTDVRGKYGATSTILAEYLEDALLDPGVQIATALLYGIRSDTQDLGQEASNADIQALVRLYPKANHRMLGRIVLEKLPRAYFELLHRGLQSAVAYSRCVISGLGEIDNPDMIGEVADLLLRDQESTWSFCYGWYQNRLLISVRTSEPDADAGKIVQGVVGRKGSGGGHSVMAGGQIPLDSDSKTKRASLEKTIVNRFLKKLNVKNERGSKLV